MMIVPKFGGETFVLIRAKCSTGQIINTDGTFYFNGDNYFECVSGLESAQLRSQEIVNSETDVEVSIFNGEGDFIQIVRP